MMRSFLVLFTCEEYTNRDKSVLITNDIILNIVDNIFNLRETEVVMFLLVLLKRVDGLLVIHVKIVSLSLCCHSTS